MTNSSTERCAAGSGRILDIPVEIVGAVASYGIHDRLAGRVNREGLSGVDKEVNVILVGTAYKSLGDLRAGYLKHHAGIRSKSHLLEDVWLFRPAARNNGASILKCWRIRGSVSSIRDRPLGEGNNKKEYNNRDLYCGRTIGFERPICPAERTT